MRRLIGSAEANGITMARRARHSRVLLAGIQQFDRHTSPIGSLDAR
jgi:hypothetical protein